MIEVYIRNESGKDRLIATFETYHEFFRGLREDDVKAFGYTEVDRTHAPRAWKDAARAITIDDFAHARYCYLAFDDGKLVTPDRLVGLFRAWWEDRPRRWGRYSWSRYAYGQYRAIKTTNERRQLESTKGEENAPKIRAARNFRNLPNSWDDFMSHNDKSWKTQSKRKHQWK